MSSPPPAGARGVNGGDADTPTFNFSRVAAAVDASIAWLDDGAGGAPPGRFPTRALDPGALASSSASGPRRRRRHRHARHRRGRDDSRRSNLSRWPGLGADPRLAAGTLRAVVCVLTNLTNENPEGCAAVRATGGLETAAALVPWCASLEGLIPGTGRAAKTRGGGDSRGIRAPRPAAGARTRRRRETRERGGGESSRRGARHAQLGVVSAGEHRGTGRGLVRDASRHSRLTRALEEERARTGTGAGAGGRRENTRAAAAKKKRAAATQVALASRPLGLVRSSRRFSSAAEGGVAILRRHWATRGRTRGRGRHGGDAGRAG